MVFWDVCTPRNSPLRHKRGPGQDLRVQARPRLCRHAAPAGGGCQRGHPGPQQQSVPEAGVARAGGRPATALAWQGWLIAPEPPLSNPNSSVCAQNIIAPAIVCPSPLSSEGETINTGDVDSQGLHMSVCGLLWEVISTHTFLRR